MIECSEVTNPLRAHQRTKGIIGARDFEVFTGRIHYDNKDTVVCAALVKLARTMKIPGTEPDGYRTSRLIPECNGSLFNYLAILLRGRHKRQHGEVVSR